MSLRLILMRHAKSSWDSPSMEDHDRPLNERGRAGAAALGKWLQSNAYLPDLVLSSDSARTRETWALVSQNLAQQPPVNWREGLYLAGAQVMLEVLRMKADGPCILMLGHNPGIAQCAAMLVQRAPDHGRFRDYPTGASTVIDFDVPAWTDVDWGKGQVVDFIVPREL